jgi:hypothetical protein
VTSAIVGNHLPQEYVSQYEATLPRVLAQAGYVSALVGKYHLGNEKDPAGSCAPATRGWHKFIGNMTPGPPSIDQTAGGGDPSGGQVCGYFQTSADGSCYTKNKDNSITCNQITADSADPNTSPSRTCLQRGGLFRPSEVCNANAPQLADFDKHNAYYVWPRTKVGGPYPAQWVDKSGDSCAPKTAREFMTTSQSVSAAEWWNEQTGPRMLTLSYNAIHTPFQKAATDVIADPQDWTSTCDSGAPERRLINNMLESIDVEIGRTLADIGLATLEPNGRRIATLNLGNTIIIIVGDNGSYGTTVRVADGFDIGRSKASVYQTGVWVPLIIAGAVVKQPGRDVDEMINVTDLFQLFGDLAGLDVKEVVPPTHLLDSQPLLPYLIASDTPAIRKTNYTQVAAGKFTPAPEERSWPCLQGNTCNDTLLFRQSLCEDNAGTWFGPTEGAPAQATSCCAVVAGNSSSINPVAQWAVRNKRYKLVELLRTNCAAPLQEGDAKPFPWAEYNTKTSQEFYDLQPTQDNPLGMDYSDSNLLKDCPEGTDPESCLPLQSRKAFGQLSRTLNDIRDSGNTQATCRSKGDGNMDLRVNDADLKAWAKYQGRGPSQYDLNQDGQTDDLDRQIIEANLGTDCIDICARADLDRNRSIDARDMTLLVKQTGKCDPVLCSGDLNGDGKVDNRDVNRMIDAQNTCNAAKPKSAALSP